MKHLKKIVTGSVAASMLVAGSLTAAPAMAEAEISASAAVANMYLWRGQDLGNGDAAVSGDVVVSAAGAYGGLWASSGDATNGTEWDAFVGWGGAWDNFTADISLWTYVYPDGGVNDDNIGDLSEVILTLGFGPVSFSYYDNVAGDTGYAYYTLGAEGGQFFGTLGYADPDAPEADYTHLDLGYAYNDNFSLTLSQVVDDGNNAGVDTDLNVVVAYSLAFD